MVYALNYLFDTGAIQGVFMLLIGTGIALFCSVATRFSTPL